jgi:hypothetical protein
MAKDLRRFCLVWLDYSRRWRLEATFGMVDNQEVDLNPTGNLTGDLPWFQGDVSKWPEEMAYSFSSCPHFEFIISAELNRTLARTFRSSRNMIRKQYDVYFLVRGKSDVFMIGTGSWLVVNEEHSWRISGWVDVEGGCRVKGRTPTEPAARPAAHNKTGVILCRCPWSS